MNTTFSNTRKMVHAESVTDGYALSAEVQHHETDNRITSMNGTVSKDGQSGYFNYYEEQDGKINYNISASSSMEDKVRQIMKATATDVHTEFDVFQNEEEA